MIDAPFPIQGIIQPYDWGGYEYLAKLTGRAKADPNTPWAELWFGAHPKGPAETPHGPLDQLLDRHGSELLGQAARLPFLLKILDVRKMLSIQVHPTKAAAEIGFAREEKAGIPRDAPHRNYRDDNHKPELGRAVTDFHLLHGFKTPAAIRATLDAMPGWASLIPVYESGGVAQLYQHVMRAEAEEIVNLLRPLAEHLQSHRDYRSSNPDFWAARAFEQYGTNDRGIFSIYWFNLVHLRPGEAIFQDAGVPHAYLEGVCVELMANSDNVLRGGLTPKHIDVPELMDKVDFSPVTPDIINPSSESSGWEIYPSPAPDFELAQRNLAAGESFRIKGDQAAIYLLLSGEVQINGTRITSGQALFQPAEQSADLAVGDDTLLFRARARTKD